MVIYLDESGDLGFDFTQKNTRRYLIISLLVCGDDAAHLAITRAVKKTLKNTIQNLQVKLSIRFLNFICLINFFGQSFFHTFLAKN